MSKLATLQARMTALANAYIAKRDALQSVINAEKERVRTQIAPPLLKQAMIEGLKAGARVEVTERGSVAYQRDVEAVDVWIPGDFAGYRSNTHMRRAIQRKEPFAYVNCHGVHVPIDKVRVVQAVD